MELDFSPVWAGWRELAHGTLVTVEVTAGAIALGCVIGLLIGLGRLDPKRTVLYGACTAYVAFVRGTPLLVQLFIWFFGLPYLGINLPAFFCGIVGMGMYSGAYVSEIVRGAIQSVARGQMEAARSLGMPDGHGHAPRHHPAGGGAHDPAVGQRVHRADQEFVPGFAADHRRSDARRPEDHQRLLPLARGLSRDRA